jgi:dipeptidyl-peptidase-4
VDKTRIGIWGWSYGGYMTALTMFKGADYFKAGVSVAPVTHWKFYDTIYTERYMDTPQNNPKGYEESAPVTHAGKLKGKLLLVHGTEDDNVHFQNSASLVNELQKANKQFQTMYYPHRNHGIGGGNTRVHLFTMITDFILGNL